MSLPGLWRGVGSLAWILFNHRSAYHGSVYSSSKDFTEPLREGGHVLIDWLLQTPLTFAVLVEVSWMFRRKASTQWADFGVTLLSGSISWMICSLICSSVEENSEHRWPSIGRGPGMGSLSYYFIVGSLERERQHLMLGYGKSETQ